MSQPPCDSTALETTTCSDCRRTFFGEACYRRHKEAKSCGNGHSVCSTIKICDVCWKTFDDRKEKHECGHGYCEICKKTQPDNHLCYMTPVKHARDRPKIVFLFYDFETQQNVQLNDGRGTRLHVPNLCVVQQVCTYCIDDDTLDGMCKYCGLREYVFQRDPVKEFVELATRPLSLFHRTICIAHNAKAFDAQFILRYLIEQKNSTPPTLVSNGMNIVVLTIGKTTFIDSLNYLHMPLSALPKAFGLPDTAFKGTFPHLFNTPENQTYVGELPPLRFYSPDTMGKTERERFLKWYDEAKNTGYIFDFGKELVEYCKMDVDILRRSCLAFRRMFLQCGDVCPFQESTTIASACSRLYRKNFLREGRIGIPPVHGYRWAQNQSHKAVSWLLWMEQRIGRTIVHAGRQREHRIPEGFRVDGYYETIEEEGEGREGDDSHSVSKHVLQFHGCFWHGCSRCYRVNRDKKTDAGDTMDDRLERTLAISRKIRTAGYALTEIWECDYDRLLATDESMRSFLRDHPVVSEKPLEPRDAFFGGRTENMVSLCDVREGERIHYVDVCSLYPYVCKTGKFPVGHPKIYIGEKDCRELIGPGPFDLLRVEGLIKCTVLPPRNLYHPVLPIRMHSRLLFALCRTCCEIMNQDACDHEDPADRELKGTWVVDEVRAAVKAGYEVRAVYEIWQYDVTQFDPNTSEGGHFAEYINTFLKIKQEASGWPSECADDDDDESKQRYIDGYESREGVKLDPSKICSNPGLRSVAKLCLNSFWGKFGQRENLPKTAIVTTRGQLMELLTSPEIEVTNIVPVNNRILYANYINHDQAVKPTPTTNVVIAAYTTAQARLKLYSYLELLGRRVLYCDTDSCIYVSRGIEGEYEPPIGRFLGDLTDELASYGAGSYISSFVSGGPKFYAFIVQRPDGTTSEVCKVKGVTLNFANNALINFAAIRSYVTGENTEPTVLRFDAIRRTELHRVVTRTEMKTCKPNSVKRRPDGEFGSLPYGYVE